MQQFEIGKNEAGQRFDKYLHKILKNAPTSFLYKMLRKKNITLNGKKAEGNEILALHDVVSMYFSEETFQKFSFGSQINLQSEESKNENEYEDAYHKLGALQIIYEDDDVCIINKPINVLSQKDTPNSISCNEWFIGYLLHTNQISMEQLQTFKPSVVNRLDRNTTGLLICGKSLKGSQIMSQCVRERTIDKIYVTICCGKFTKCQNFDGYLIKDEAANKVSFYQKLDDIPANMKNTGDVSAVKTGFEPLAHTDHFTLVKVSLYTGKTHQIRAHLSSLGYPILGDSKYGSMKMNKRYQEKQQLLHAYCLKMPDLDGLLVSNKVFFAPFPITFSKYFPGGESYVNMGN